MAILITGMGVIGVNACRKFVDEGYQVVFYDIAPREVDLLDEVKDKINIVRGDMLDFPFFLETVQRYDAEGIVHTATPRTDEQYPNYYLGTAIDGMRNILEIARMKNLKMVFMSSNAVYGPRLDTKSMNEEDKTPSTWPTDKKYQRFNLYVANKICCEMLMNAYHAIYQVDAVTVRTSWVYGPADQNIYYLQEFLVGALIGEPVRYRSGQNHKIDFTYAKDVADGIFRAYTIRPIRHRVFNISSGRLYSLKEVAEEVKRIVPDAVIELGPGRLEGSFEEIGLAGRHYVQNAPLDISRAREELDYNPTPLDQGIKETRDWLKKQGNLSAYRPYRR